jgi:hypothetical protein|tara:strand:+ start:1459 stop:2112 length:654 start_codon:yes stop_codon:yes gene_type:complete
VSVVAGFAIVVTEAVFSLWKKVHAINFGIYGVSKAGKTTLHHQLRTRGEVPNISKRTVGLHRATRKLVKIDGDAHTLKTADVGGESKYWNEWMKDLRKRKVKYVIFLLDNRHLNGNNMEQQIAWKFLVDLICKDKWPGGKKKKSNDYPLAVGLWANKADLWAKGFSKDPRKHEIFDPFRYGMSLLNDKGIPTHQYIISAKTDSEMVYRGIMTMINDY